MLHQDGSTHEWVPGCQWDLMVTLDDATGAMYSAFFVEEEGTQSSFRGLQEVIEAQGLFSSLYTDRGSPYWHTEDAGGKVDKTRLTQVHRALQQVGITLIAAYFTRSPGPIRTSLPHPAGSAAQRIGARGDHRHGSRQSIPDHSLHAGL